MDGVGAGRGPGALKFRAPGLNLAGGRARAPHTGLALALALHLHLHLHALRLTAPNVRGAVPAGHAIVVVMAQ